MVQQNQPSQRAGNGSYLRMVRMQLVKGLEPGTPQLEPYMVACHSLNFVFLMNELQKPCYAAVHLHQD